MTFLIAIIGLFLIGAMFAWALVHGGRRRDARDDANAIIRMTDDGGPVPLGDWSQIVKPTRRVVLPFRAVQKLKENSDARR